MFNQLTPSTQPTLSLQVTAQPGQQVTRARAPSLGGGPTSEHCLRFATIKERANPKETAVCAGRQPRERHVYTSISNTLEVHVVSAAMLRGEAQFMIHYEGNTPLSFSCSICSAIMLNCSFKFKSKLLIRFAFQR